MIIAGGNGGEGGEFAVRGGVGCGRLYEMVSLVCDHLGELHCDQPQDIFVPGSSMDAIGWYSPVDIC